MNLWWLAVYAGVQAYASIRGSQAHAAALREQAEIAKLSGEFAIEDAQRRSRAALEAGHEQATYIRRQSRRNIGSWTAAAGNSGVELSGSRLLVAADQIKQDENAAAMTVINALAQASSARASGMAAMTERRATADALQRTAGAVETGGYLDAIARGLSAYALYEHTTGGSGGAINYGSNGVNASGVGNLPQGY